MQTNTVNEWHGSLTWYPADEDGPAGVYDDHGDCVALIESPILGRLCASGPDLLRGLRRLLQLHLELVEHCNPIERARADEINEFLLAIVAKAEGTK